MDIQNIETTQIDPNDRTYLFTYGRSIGQLKNSIGQIGIIQPISIEKISDSGKYRIISGLQRTLAALELGITSIPAKIYSETAPLKLFEMALHENATQRSFNAVEIAIVIEKLTVRFKVPNDVIVSQYLSLSGLGANAKLIPRYLGILKLDESLKTALAADNIGIEVAQKLGELSPVDCEIIFRLFLALKLGKNRQREFLNFFHDVARLNDISFSQIAKIINIAQILADDTLQTPVKTEIIRQALYQLRYPRLSEVEEKYQTVLQKLKLPAGIKITPFPFFEETRYTVQFDFRDQSMLRKKVKALQKLVENPALEELIFLE